MSLRSESCPEHPCCCLFAALLSRAACRACGAGSARGGQQRHLPAGLAQCSELAITQRGCADEGQGKEGGRSLIGGVECSHMREQWACMLRGSGGSRLTLFPRCCCRRQPQAVGPAQVQGAGGDGRGPLLQQRQHAGGPPPLSPRPVIVMWLAAGNLMAEKRETLMLVHIPCLCRRSAATAPTKSSWRPAPRRGARTAPGRWCCCGRTRWSAWARWRWTAARWRCR